MAKNKDLGNAKVAKNDEFYTQLEDINAELVHYESQFKDKVVLMNCDDPTWSNFWRYFHMEFERLGLKKIISTHFESGEVESYKLEYTGGNDEDFEIGIRTTLTQNGDFRSPECIELLKEADIVVTNPPFSLFREFITLLVEYNKKFIIWGNNNAITYKEVFPLLKDNKVWLGYLCNKTCVFRVGDDYKYDKKLTDAKNDGYKYGKVPAISVFTNMDIKKRHELLDTPYLYSKKDDLYPDLYPKFANHDAINVNKVSEIPMDYNDVMGVPITYLEFFNPEQFEIIGLTSLADTMDKPVVLGQKFVDMYKSQGGTGHFSTNMYGVWYIDADGLAVKPYGRLLIKRKDGNKDGTYDVNQTSSN